MSMYVSQLAELTAMPERHLLLGNPYIRGFLQGICRRGYDPEKILAKAGISPHVYRDPDGHIDGRQFRDLWLTALQETDDIFLGFLEQPGKRALEREQFRTRLRCTTLGEAARVGTQFKEAVRNDISYEYLVDTKRHEFTLQVNYKLAQDVDEHIFYWHRLLLIYRYYCWLIGKQIKLNRICFFSSKPDFCADYQQFFNCEVLFDQPHNALSFDQKYLHFPVVPRTEDEEMGYLETYNDWFDAGEDGRSWSGQVAHILTRLQREGNWSPSTEEVAAMLGVGKRTLRRLLARENETFRGIKTRLRHHLAEKLLVTTDLSITIVANQVGYQEPGDFTRAFLTWTNTTPSAFREQHRSDKALIASYASKGVPGGVKT